MSAVMNEYEPHVYQLCNMAAQYGKSHMLSNNLAYFYDSPDHDGIAIDASPRIFIVATRLLGHSFWMTLLY